MKNLPSICFCILACSWLQPVMGHELCPPPGFSKSELVDLRSSGFKIEAEARNKLALGLMACVGNPDPEIRDGVVFEGLSTWLRSKRLSGETITILYRDLINKITEIPDEAGFLHPFVVLLLSEVSRTDRVEAHFSAEQRAELVDVASSYLAGVTDYRGFSDIEGWRHGVAHGSDLVLQLVLNTETNEQQMFTLMEAVATQVSPAGEVFYTYGEPARLARPLIYAFQRGLLSDEFWQNWFEGISKPAPLDSWRESYSSNAGLARRHNTLAFLMAVYFYASNMEDEQGIKLKDLVMNAVKIIS